MKNVNTTAFVIGLILYILTLVFSLSMSYCVSPLVFNPEYSKAWVKRDVNLTLTAILLGWRHKRLRPHPLRRIEKNESGYHSQSLITAFCIFE